MKCLQTLGLFTYPTGSEDLPATDTKTPPGEQKTRARRTRTSSKAAQAISALFTPDGITKRAIVTGTGFSAEKVEATLSAMQKSGAAYVKNSRWFDGPSPAKAANRKARTTKATGTKTTATKSTGGVSLSDGILRAVANAREQGAVASDILGYLSREYGMTVRPNHLGIALQRHRRANRLENRNDRWYARNVEEFRQAS